MSCLMKIKSILLSIAALFSPSLYAERMVGQLSNDQLIDIYNDSYSNYSNYAANDLARAKETNAIDKVTINKICKHYDDYKYLRMIAIQNIYLPQGEEVLAFSSYALNNIKGYFDIIEDYIGDGPNEVCGNTN